MAISEITPLLSNIENKIENKEFYTVFKSLKNEADKLNIPGVSKKLRQLEETYKYMSHYMTEGYEDASRDATMDNIASELKRLKDVIAMEIMLKDSPDQYSATKRFIRIRNTRLQDIIAAVNTSSFGNTDNDIIDIEKTKQYETDIDSLFNYVWTMAGTDQSDYKQLYEFFILKDDFIIRTQIISALLLGNIKFLDTEAMRLLSDLYLNIDDEILQARILAAIMIILAVNGDKASKDKSLFDNLQRLSFTPNFEQKIRNVTLEIIKTTDTRRITSKMENEVMPELMKIRPDIINKLKDNTANKAFDAEGINPEWEELIEKSGVAEKLRELTEMQLEGGDVMMLAFSNLKGFPFFSNVSNWFLPFYPSRSELIGRIENDSMKMFEDILHNSGIMCNSDKYSFAFSMLQMPEAQRKLMTTQMMQQMEQVHEMAKDNKVPNTFESETRIYLRDLYRFFKLYRKHSEFSDPFINADSFTKIPIFDEILKDGSFLQLIGEFLLKRGYYKEALSALEALNSLDNSDPHLWEKIGYCYNALKNIEKAVEWYRKAELFNPDSLWLIKRLASTLRQLKQYADAAEYYEKALLKEPENITLITGAAHSYLKNGDYDNALAKLYHANYLRSDNSETWRAIAWAELLRGNLDKSLSFYDRILNSDEVTDEDYLNIGHASMKSKEYKKAVESYRRFLSLNGNDFQRLEEAINSDFDALRHMGISQTEIRLIIDKLHYDFE